MTHANTAGLLFFVAYHRYLEQSNLSRTTGWLKTPSCCCYHNLTFLQIMIKLILDRVNLVTHHIIVCHSIRHVRIHATNFDGYKNIIMFIISCITHANTTSVLVVYFYHNHTQSFLWLIIDIYHHRMNILFNKEYFDAYGK
ncbi:hypothetical protein ACJX0J_005946, partial [Zea mays]